MTKPLFFTVGADITPGSKAFDQLASKAAKSMGDIDKSFDGTKSKGAQVADAIGGQLDELEATMRGTKEAADVLGKALGPELSAKVNLTDAATKFQQLGLSVDDIKLSVNDLADTIRRTDQLTTSGLDGEIDKVGDSAKQAAEQLEQMGKADVTPVAGGLDEVNKKLGDDVPRSAGSANSALANMYGNSAQSLGGLIGITGDLGMGIGQMGEYAADAALDGERLGSALGSMAKVAGPIALLGLAVQSVGEVQSRFADSTERTSKDVEAWSDSIEAGGDAALNYAGKLEEAGKVMVDVTRAQSTLTNVVAEADSHWYTTGIGVHLLAEALGAGKDEVKDITPLLAQAGISAQQFAEAASNPRPAQMQAELAAALAKTTVSADDQKLIMLGVTQSQEDFATASANGAITQKVFGDATAQAATAQREYANSVESAKGVSDGYSKTQQEVADTIDRVNDKLLEQADALNAQIDSMTTSADATLAAQDAQAKFAEAASHTIEVQADGEATQKDKTDAVNAERDALIDAAKRQEEANEKTAAAKGVTETATQKVDGFNASLLNNANYATPAAQQAAARYIAEVNGIPPEKATEILALIQQGKLDEAKQALDDASVARKAAIIADANTAPAKQDIDALNGRQVTIAVKADTTSASTALASIRTPRNAGGGPVDAGGATWVGDKFGIDSPSAELFVPGSDGTIYNQSQLAAAAAASGSSGGGALVRTSGGGGSTVIHQNWTVNVPPGVGARDMTAAIQRQIKYNGPAAVKRLLQV